MVTELEIKEFYDNITFPGLYSAQDVTNIEDYLIHTRYLDFFSKNKITTMLDVGCGTGFVTNVIAYHNPDIKIVAVDFSDSINHGKKISQELNITNIEWKQINFFDLPEDRNFDVVLSNGSAHHMPNFKQAIEKIKRLSNQWILIGLYNKYGKWIQRTVIPSFSTKTFELDQLQIPFELSFTNSEVKNYFNDFTLENVSPSICGWGVDFFNLFKGKWGGFSFYTFKK